MKQLLNNVIVALSAIRLVPHIAIAATCRERRTIAYEVWRWWSILYPAPHHSGQQRSEHHHPVRLDIDGQPSAVVDAMAPVYPRAIGPVAVPGSRPSTLDVGRFFWLMTFYPEFRSLFYHRGGLMAKLFRPLCPGLSTLHIATAHIGPGLFIQHGFATIIAAERIGRDCWVNQQATIGYDDSNGRPTMGDRVRIAPGAKVIGNVLVGSDSVVGANAVVVKDLADASVIVPSRGRIVRRGGERVDEEP